MIPQVLLLCGGKSSRMDPLSDKILFKYLGKTVLEHQIDMLLAVGFTEEVHIVVNSENSSTVQSILKTNYPSEFSRFTFSIQENFQQGMLNGILSAKTKVNMEKAILVMSSNDFVEKIFFKNLLEQYQTSNSDIFICGKKVEKYFPGGYLVLKDGKYVKNIYEKPGKENQPSDFINLVFHLFRNPKLLFQFLEKEYEVSPVQDGYEQCLQNLFNVGQKCEMVLYDGFWQALKYPWHHLVLMDFFLTSMQGQRIHESVKLPKNVSISNAVVFEEGVRIFDFAVINGPAYIGKNCVLGNHSLVRGSMIGENSVIGHTTEIARSYLRSNIWTHQNYIGDSILDENISFGAGTRTGNFRLDEGNINVQVKSEKVNTERNKLGLICGKNVRVGINTSFMPGIKIGKNSCIGAGIIVSDDVLENSFLKGIFQNERRENKYISKEKSNSQ